MTQEPTTFTEQLTEFISYKRYPSLWQRLSQQDRDKINNYEFVITREKCIEVLQREQFYTSCSFNEIVDIMDILQKPFTFNAWVSLFKDFNDLQDVEPRHL